MERSKRQNAAIFARSSLLFLTCTAAGFLNGFLGTGGGILLIFAMRTFCREREKDYFAMALSVMLPISLITSVLYWRSGAYALSDVSFFVLPSITGGIGGAFLTDKLPTKLLNRCFSLLVIYGGFSLLLNR